MSHLDICGTSYGRKKGRESKLGQFRDSKLRSPGTKSHLNVAPVEWHRVYDMGEGGGFPRVRAVVSQVSPELPLACPSTSGAPECDLTNLLVGFIQV
jgi:hypothetical protein